MPTPESWGGGQQTRLWDAAVEMAQTVKHLPLECENENSEPQTHVRASWPGSPPVIPALGRWKHDPWNRQSRLAKTRASGSMRDSASVCKMESDIERLPT